MQSGIILSYGCGISSRSVTLVTLADLRSCSWVAFFNRFPLAACLALLGAMRVSPHKGGFQLRYSLIFLSPVCEVDSVFSNMVLGAEF